MTLNYSAKMLNIEQAAGITHVGLPPRQVDNQSIRELYELTAALSDEHDVKLLIDLTGIPSASSGLMGMLVTMKKKCLSFGGQLIIAAPDPMILEQFQIMNLHLILTIEPDVQAAKSRFKP